MTVRDVVLWVPKVLLEFVGESNSTEERCVNFSSLSSFCS